VLGSTIRPCAGSRASASNVMRRGHSVMPSRRMSPLRKPRRKALVTFGLGPHPNADSKLILSWAVGGRDAGYALALMDDLRSEEAFGADIDNGMLVKLYGAETGGQGHERKYSPSECIGARKETRP
jgi:hypothetical protein